MNNNNLTSKCPLCCGSHAIDFFPWRIKYRENIFYYKKCNSCGVVFLNPVPEINLFNEIYKVDAYHDIHYSEVDEGDYDKSLKLINNRFSAGDRVLDYGCGAGHFLRVARNNGLVGFGVEYSVETAELASDASRCRVFNLDEFNNLKDDFKFDIIHMGDVLEHLPNPSILIKKLISHLTPNGILYIQGPIENNPSLVYMLSYIFGIIKKTLNPLYIGEGVPSHLLRFTYGQKLKFIENIDERLNLVESGIYDTGWPYCNGGIIKKIISILSIAISWLNVFGLKFGNRCYLIFVLK